MRPQGLHADYQHSFVVNSVDHPLSLRRYLLVTVFGFAAGSVLVSPDAYAGSPALPTGGRYMAGAGHIGMSGPGTLTINQSSARGIINWQGFSIGAGGKVEINNGAGATLNRVSGGDLSRIDGSLSGSGSIYLINPNGVVVGAGGKVVAGGSFVASSRDVPDGQFMKGGTLTAQGSSPGTVTNEGTIIAKDGDVVMIGQSAANSGHIAAPGGTAALVAGDKVLLAPVNGPAGVYVAPDAAARGGVTNTGSISAAAAALKSAGGDVYALAGNRNGIIQATGTKTIAGQIWLSAPNGEVSVTGSLKARNADAAGGSVIADGQAVSVGATARISANGLKGGTVLIGVSGIGGHDEARHTRIAAGARITARGRRGGGHIETSGKTLALGKALVSAGQGGSWLIDPTDLVIDSTAASTIQSSLNSGTSVTEQTTSSGASGAGVPSSGPGDISINAPISWTNAAASLTIQAYHAINVNAPVTGKGAVMMAAGGTLTIAAGASVTGDAGVTLGTTANFINNGGASAVSAGSSGRWLVYSTSPSGDTDGGLTPDFLQYAASFPAGGSGATAPAQATGNGFLYSVTPSLTVSLTGTVTKPYDGTSVAPLASSNYSLSGLINGDTGSLTGSFGAANAGTRIAVTPSGLTAYHGSAATPVYGYAIANPGVSATIGTISPALITTTITGNPTKIYDGTTTATLTSANYSLSGFVAGQSATVTQPSAVAYGAANAGAQTVTASLIRTDFAAGTGTTLSNYQFATTATGSGTISQAPLDITGVLATNKTYDRTAADTLATGSAGLYGVIGADTVTLSSAAAIGTFASANAGNGLTVTASGFALSGAQAGNYRLVEPSGLAANIAPAPLSIQGVTATSKVYDGTNADALGTSGARLSGVISGDTISLSSAAATGGFASADVGNGIAVAANGFSISGAAAGNYSLAQPSGLAAAITPAPLSVTITGTPVKTYDGTATAVVASSGYTLSGFVSGQSATIGQTSMAQYASANAASQPVTSALAISDFMPAHGTVLSNYSLPAAASGTGTINPAVVTVLLEGNPQKVYDGTLSANLGGSNFFLTGFVGGQGVAVNQTAGNFSSANVGVQTVSADLTGQYTPNSGTLLGNYSLPALVQGYGTITPAPLSGHVLATIINDPTKFYDGTNAAALTSADFSLAGFASGQGATVNQTTGQYATANVGVQPVTASLTAGNFTPNSGTNLSNYTLPTTAYGTGTINPAILTATIIGNPTKIYNGTTTGVASPSNYQFSGFAPGQGVTINQSALLNYGAASTGSQSVSATLATTDFTPNAGTALINYVLPGTATGTGTILPADLYITGVAATTKTYDTTTADALTTAAAALAGVVGADAVTLSSQNAAGTFASANAAPGISVAASGFTISGANAFDYQLIQPAGLAATITPVSLTISGVTAVSRAYDATNADTLSTNGATLNGVLGSDSVSLSSTNAAGTFGSVNIGSGLSVAASGFSIGGAQAGNYSLNQPGNLTADITPAPLTAVVIGNPTKTYDATTSTTLLASNYIITGFVAGQGASLPQTASASYASANAGPEAITATLVSSDFAANSGTNLANYALPTTGTGAGTIDQAPVMAQIIRNPTKTYDTTTAAALTQANYSLFGLLAGQSAGVTQTAGTYGSASAGAESVTATLASGDFNPGAGTLLSNYALPATASGPGTINQALLTINGVAATDKIYNASTADSLNVAGAAVAGLLGSDTVTLSSAGAFGTFTSANVGSNIGVTANGFAISGGESADYALAQPTGLAANITQAGLNLASVTKVYDSTTSVPSTSSAYRLTGIYGGDSVSLSMSGLTGSYVAKNIATRLSVSLSGMALTGASAGNYSIAASVTNAAVGIITPAPLGVTGVTANNKVYDTTTAASLTNSSAALAGEFTGDAVSLSTSGAIGVFASPDAGTGIAVAASGYTISGADARNYSLSQPAGLTAAITPDPSLTLTSVTKTYDSTTSLPTGNTAYALSGVLGSDTVLVNTAGLSGGFASPNVGSSLNVSITGMTLTGAQAGDYSIASSVSADPIGTINPALLHVAIINNPTKTYDATNAAILAPTNYDLSGFVGSESASITKTAGTYGLVAAGSEPVSTTLANADFSPASGTALSNYTLPTVASGTGTINKAGLIITGVNATDKVYNDDSFDALNTGTAALSGVASGDTVTLATSGASGTFASLNVGSGIAVSAHGFTISGTDAADYTLTQPAGLSAAITPATLTLTGVTKLYDSTTSLPSSSAAYSLSGIYGTDIVSLNTGSLAGSFAAKNVGTGLSVTASGLALSGAQGGDYQIASNVSAALIGAITPASLSVTGETATNKVYDGTTTDALNNQAALLNGVLGADTVILGAPATGTFSSSNVGAGIVVSAANYTISGADAGNYNLIEPHGLAAGIMAAPLTATITGTPSKTYDGSVAAALVAGDFGLTGFVAGQSASINQTAGTYASSDAGAEAVTAGLSSGNFIAGSGTALSNYVLPTSAIGTGQINQAALAATIIGTPSKTYDGSIAATLVAGDFGLTGFVAGQSASINQTAGTYASADAGAEAVTAGLAAANFIAGSSTTLSNYVLPTSATGTGQINQAALAATIIGTPSKTYDGSIAATLVAGDFGLTGFVAGQSASINQTAGTYASANAGPEAVTAGLAAANFIAGSGTSLSNYVLPASATGTGQINQAPLTATIIGIPTKTYDGTTQAALTPGAFALSGFIAGQSASINQTAGTYASANAGAEAVTAGLAQGSFIAGSNTALSNYVLPTSAAGTGQINQAMLAAAITGMPSKTYDGSVTATLVAADFGLAGFVAGQGATVTQSNGVYAAANAGTEAVSTSLAGTDFTPGSGTSLANYILPTAASGTGLINQASLTATIIDTPSKTYDGSVAAALVAGDFGLTGFVAGQSASINETAGTYASADAGAEAVTAGLSSGNFIAGSGTALSNYVLPTSATGTGQINQAALAATIIGTPSKTYDGSVAATLVANDFGLTGFVAGQSASINQTAGTYASANAGTEAVTAGLAAGNFIAGSGTSLSNYMLPTSATGTGQINQAALAATIIGMPSKTYDGSVTATLVAADFGLAGFVAGQGATVTQSNGVYAAADAGTEAVSTSLAGTDFTPGSGTSLANYTLPTAASGTGLINQAPLMATITGTPSKTYDGSITATLVANDFGLSGFIAGQGASINQTAGTYASANAGAEPVTAGLASGNFIAGSGTNLSNYVLPSSATGSGQINQAPLGITIIATPTKIYDGTDSAPLMQGNFALSGFVGSQGASVDQPSGTYAAANAGTEAVTATLAPHDFIPDAGTLLSNYVLPRTAAGAGLINKAPLDVTAQIIGNPAKTYDGGTAATLGSDNFLLTGFVSGQGAVVTRTTGAYASANAGTEAIVVNLVANDFLAGAGTNLANYALPNMASGQGTIAPALLTAVISGTPTKIYDGTAQAALMPDEFTLAGFVGDQSATVTQNRGSFAMSNAGAQAVSARLGAGNLTAGSGTNLANYILPTVASGTGRIDRAALTAAIIGSPAKTYDGTTRATLSPGDFALSGFIAGQGATVTQNSGIYASANAGADAVSANLAGGDFIAGSGTSLANYILPAAASGTGRIDQAALQVIGVSAENKLFDGSRTATLMMSNAALQGLASTDHLGLSTTDATGRFVSAGVGDTIEVAASGFTISGFGAANYGLVQPSGLTANIAPSTLMAALIGNLPAGDGMSGTGQTITTSAIAGVTPVIDIPFPAPSGLSTRGGNIFGSLPVIVTDAANAKAADAGAASDTDTLASHQPLIVSPEEILLQGIKDKVWHITLPASTPLTSASKLHS